MSWLREHVDPGMAPEELAAASRGRGRWWRSTHLGVPRGTATSGRSGSAGCSSRRAERRPAPGLPRRPRRRAAAPDRLRRAQRDAGTNRRRRAARRGAPGRRRAPQGEADARRGVERDDPVRDRAAPGRRRLGDHRAGGRHRRGPRSPTSCRCRRWCSELEGHVEPARTAAVYGVARGCTRVTGAPLAPLDESDPPAEAGAESGTTRASRCWTRPVPALHGPRAHRRPRRPSPWLARHRRRGGGDATDLQRRRHHELSCC